MTSLHLSKLSKRYRGAKTLAIEDVTLKIAPGEVYGFLGSNGAGKSTTIRTVLGFLQPTKGSIKIFGKDAVRHGVSLRKDIGYLAGDVALPKRVTGRKLLKYLASLSGGVDKAYEQTLVDRFEAQLDKKVDTLSKGNRQKIGLIQALMHQPKLLVLDEPTSGLDPVMQERFYQSIEEARERGAAVFLSSHSFQEVERICDRIGIIRDGQLVHEGPVAKFLSEQKPSWRVTVKTDADVKKLGLQPALEVLEIHDKTLTVEPKFTIAKALSALSTVNVTAMSSAEREVEDEFMSFYSTDQEASDV